MKVAIIPARGGSRRIPRKNVRLFCGQPIIAWSIRAAQESGCFDRIVVSTDDPEIAGVAREFGAESPFQRPAALSDDFAGTAAVVQHAVEWLRLPEGDDSFTCCIYATAPLLDAQDLVRGLAELRGSEANFAISIARYDYPVQRALRMSLGGHIALMHPELADTRSQDLEEAFHDAGQFYWGRTRAWLTGESLLAGSSIGIRLPSHRVQDIDTEEDWLRAELLFMALRATSVDRKKNTPLSHS